MNIWLLTTEFPPYFGGGIATYAHTTVQILAQKGHTVTVFVNDDGVDSMVTTMQGTVRIVRFPNTAGPRLAALGPTSRLSYNFALWTAHFVQLEGPPDIIESQEYMGIAAHLLQRKRTLDPVFANIPVVVTAHNPKFILDPIDRAPTYQFPDYWTGEMERFCLSAADGVISPSHYLQAALMKDMPHLHPEVIPNPYILPRKESRAQQRKLLYVGRLQYFKGILTLLESLAPLWDQGFSWPLEIVAGDSYFFPKGEMMKSYILRRYARYFKKHLIRIHPAVAPAALHQIYAEAYALVLPSVFDNLPYIVLEAMAQECLVVATRRGGQQEVIEDSVSGILTEPDAMSHALQQAVSLRAEDRAEMGANARARVAWYTDPNRIYEQKIAYFKQVANQKAVRIFPFLRRDLPERTTVSGADSSLSVVIPYYNLGPYLLDTLKSLDRVHQSTPLAIIVVDDGSTDGVSIAALRKAQQRYPYIVIHRTANHGLAQARNFGAQQAATPYIAFLDADDMVDPRYYPRALSILQHYPNVSFVGCWAQYFGADQQIWPTWNPEPPYALYHNPLNTSALIYRREDFLTCGQNDPDMEYGMEDYESMIRMIGQGCRGVSIPEPYFFYRVRAGSMSRGFNADNQMFLYRLIVQKNPDIFARYATDLLSLFNANGPQYLVDNPGQRSPTATR